MLASNAESVSFLAEYLRSIGCTETDAPDIIVFGFQEVIDLESRKLTASECLCLLNYLTHRSSPHCI